MTFHIKLGTKPLHTISNKVDMSLLESMMEVNYNRYLVLKNMLPFYSICCYLYLNKNQNQFRR